MSARRSTRPITWWHAPRSPSYADSRCAAIRCSSRLETPIPASASDRLRITRASAWESRFPIDTAITDHRLMRETADRDRCGSARALPRKRIAPLRLDGHGHRRPRGLGEAGTFRGGPGVEAEMTTALTTRPPSSWVLRIHTADLPPLADGILIRPVGEALLRCDDHARRRWHRGRGPAL